MFLAAGVFPRHEPEIRHQGARRLKPPKVVQLGQHHHRRQRLDPPEAPQPPHRVLVGCSRCDGGQLGVELPQPRVEVIDRQQIVIHHDPFGRVLPCQAVDPAPMRLRPVPSAVVQAAAQEQLAHPVPTALPIRSRVVTGAAQVADRFVGRRRGADLGEETRATIRPASAHRAGPS